ncbi:MAG: ABC transporter permease, partial [Pseudomonadota bacterium]
MSLEADFTELEEDGERIMRFSGRLTIARLGDVPQRLDAIAISPARVDITAVDRVDTVGAWLLHKLTRDHGAEIAGASDHAQRLIRQVTIADDPAKTYDEDEGRLHRIIQRIGASTLESLSSLKGLLAFFGGLLIATGSVIRHPGRMRFNAVVQRFETVGVSALGIIGLMSFLIGIVIAQQGAVQLRQFGAEVFTINLVGRITTRELG